MSRVFIAGYSQFKEIMAYIREELDALGCEKAIIDKAHVICDELITNIIKNAYEGIERCNVEGMNCPKPLEIFCLRKLNGIIIKLADWGKPFNPLGYSGDPSEKAAHGGFGIGIVKGLADSIEYEFKNGRNLTEFFLEDGK
ncbi:MAG: ATP-binding protein [Bacteroidota bacterium]